MKIAPDFQSDARLRWRHQPTIDYLARRTAEGKSKREIVRCLKRYVAREVYAVLTEDIERTEDTASLSIRPA